MTRGTIILFTNRQTIETTEFNGDMYLKPQSNGQIMIDLLKKVKTEKDFREAITKFNKDNFGYQEELFYPREKKTEIVFTKGTYFNRWFSDYLYFLNLSDKTISFTDISIVKKKLKPKKKIFVFNFGEFYKAIPVK